ncbi:MAG: heavy-metal-associated domain-containing protein [Pseudomonadota bacterium]
MIEFKVPRMSCGGCVNTITRAINIVDEDAKIKCDTNLRTVSIDSDLSELELKAILIKSGYAPVGS